MSQAWATMRQPPSRTSTIALTSRVTVAPFSSISHAAKATATLPNTFTVQPSGVSSNETSLPSARSRFIRSMNCSTVCGLTGRAEGNRVAPGANPPANAAQSGSRSRVHARLLNWALTSAWIAAMSSVSSDMKRDASVLDYPLGIPRHFPQMPVEILEVSGVAAPEPIVRRLHADGTCVPGLLHHGVDFGLRSDVVGDAELGLAATAQGDAGIVGQAPARPERELQTGLEIEERDRPVFELRADDAFGLEAEPVAIELDRSLEVVDAECDEGYPRFHERALREAITAAARWEAL